ncbi:MAG: PEGA domain-containing protein [Candidatus Shapirobacteria bacterium]|nr:PEGA domain-containing protein [Candidatus Shapirobacteria bacterium]
MIKKRIFIFLIVIVGIAIGAFYLSKFASGYRPDFSTKSLQPTGLLVATSFPNQATVFVNGKAIKNKTTTTISLAPDEYQVEIKKDGFTSWQKKLTIEKELVVKTDAYLFPTYPDLKALTFTGAASPVISPNGKKVVYSVSKQDDKNGLWVLGLNERQLLNNQEAQQIIQSTAKYDFSQSTYQWSTDSKQILITFIKVNPSASGTKKIKAVEENFLININNNDLNLALTDITNQKETLLADWKKEEEIIAQAQISRLPEELTIILDKAVKDIVFSPDETKIMYIATASASIPKDLITQMPGASTQKESREIENGKTYIYDLKEDRNFALDLPTDAKISWFPNSRYIF